jgi:7-cyano-7-deazaguanine synthase in queuosine biosynthesis
LQKDFIFHDDDQDSLRRSFSNAIEYTDPYGNIVDELNQEVIFLVSGNKNEETSTSNHELVLIEKELQVFHDASHESLCYNENGKVLHCGKCKSDFPRSI